MTHAFSETCIFPLSLSLCLCLESEFQTFGHGEIKKSQTVQAILSCRYGGFNMLLCTIVENGANTRICRKSCECRDYALFCLFFTQKFTQKNRILAEILPKTLAGGGSDGQCKVDSRLKHVSMFPVKVSVSNRPSTPLVVKKRQQNLWQLQKSEAWHCCRKKQPQSKALLTANSTVPPSLEYQQESIRYTCM